MESLILLVILLVLGAPLTMSIIALVLAVKARGDVRELHRQLLMGRRPKKTPAVTATPQPAPKVVPTPQAAPAVPAPKTASTPAPPRPPPPPGPAKQPGGNLEVTLGGKVASFVGIGTLVLGVVFFVGYAIQHGWIGPAMRVTLGMLTGGVLIAIGHLMERKNKNLAILARVLTGGGAALLYFSVFAAHGIYGLIGPAAAVGGLVVVAAAVLALAAVYRSQIVGILGVLGAFLTPAVIGGDFSRGVFPLAYIVAVNATVMGLGLRRNWQSLYNIAFGFTAVYGAMWLERELGGDAELTGHGMIFCLVCFAEFIGLGLIKLKGERGQLSQVVDLLRMLATSLLLLGAVYWILDARDLNAWIGLAFLVLAAVHLGIVKLAWRWLPRFKYDILVLLAGALTFSTLALPAQLDGVWVSLGWSIEGLVLAVFAWKYRVSAFQIAGLFLGLLGLSKALLFDFSLYDHNIQPLFFNSRFMVGLGSAVLLGAQSWIYGRSEELLKSSHRILEDAILLIASVGFVIAVAVDGLLVLDGDAPWAWLLSSIALAVVGVFLLLVGGSRSSTLRIAGIMALILVPAKLMLVDGPILWFEGSGDFEVFVNSVFLVGLLLVAGGAITLRLVLPKEPEHAPPPFLVPVLFNIVSIVSVIFLVTLEIFRTKTDWQGTAVTLWWAACALALIIIGLNRQIRYLRYTALILFCITLAKVFLFDLSELNGLIRVAAFIGVGLILLVLSFLYQRLAPHLQPDSTSQPEPSDET